MLIPVGCQPSGFNLDNIVFTLTENIGFKRKSVFVIIILLIVVVFYCSYLKIWNFFFFLSFRQNNGYKTLKFLLNLA